MEKFYSLLFADEASRLPEGSCPGYFTDLNLDQIINAVVSGAEDTDVAGYYYTPLRDHATIIYRQQVAAALDDARLMEAVNAFLFEQRQVNRALANSEKAKIPEQHDKWLLDGAVLYCASVRRLSEAISGLKPAAHALELLGDFLAGYVSAPEFTALETESCACCEALGSIRYDMQIESGRVFLEFPDGDDTHDIARALSDTFMHICDSRFDTTLAFFPGAELNPLEREILAVMKKRFPDRFARCAAAAAKISGFMEPHIARLPGELWFYIAYRNYIEPLRQNGMLFCCPQLLSERCIEVRGAFDLALAAKQESPASSVITNDFYLDSGEKIFILTGPNQGGKTTFARSYGQIMYLASLGLQVPACAAKLCLASKIFTHFATEEDLSSHSGRLQEELLRLERIVAEADGDSLLIFNEMFATTTTYDAIRLGARVLKWVTELGALCLYVSHIPDLSSACPGSVSLIAEVVSPDNPERTYKIRRRPADGEAYANSIARKYSLTYRDIIAAKQKEERR